MTRASKADQPEGRRAGRASVPVVNRQTRTGLVIAALIVPILLSLTGPAGSAPLGGHCVLALDPAPW
jgi:hypothetical protein